MATFVIVHGEFGGGWEWSPVARLLRGLGHEVYTPTLTGVGEHSHLAGDNVVGLSTHVQDVVGLLEFEDLRDVVLCGAGYGGVPVTSAADRVAYRIGMVVYLDALVPKDGESALDLLPSEFGELVVAGLEGNGDSWRVPVPPGWVPPAGWGEGISRSTHLARLRGQPAMTLFEPTYLTTAIDHIPRAFVRCTREGLNAQLEYPIAQMVQRAVEGGWHYREIDATHEPQFSNPNATVRVLSELAVSLLGQAPNDDTDALHRLRSEHELRLRRILQNETELWSPN